MNREYEEAALRNIATLNRINTKSKSNHDTEKSETPKNITLLIEAGEALFGRRWQTALAFEMGLKNRNLIKHWLQRKHIPTEGLDALNMFIDKRRELLDKVQSKIQTQQSRDE